MYLGERMPYNFVIFEVICTTGIKGDRNRSRKIDIQKKEADLSGPARTLTGKVW